MQFQITTYKMPMTDHYMKFEESNDDFKGIIVKHVCFWIERQNSIKNIDSVPISGTAIDGIIIRGTT